MDVIKCREEIIEEIISNFDFKKIEKVMNFLNWRYYTDRVPTALELVELSTRLLRNAFDGLCLTDTKNYYVETGGLRASMWKIENGIEGKLEFVLENYESINIVKL